MRLAAAGLVLSRGGRTIVEGLSLTLASGEALVVTGPNGAGKSTLLRALAGLLEPESGLVSFETLDAEPDPVSTHAHYLGHAEALKGALTARENLEFWASMLGAGDGLSPVAALERLALGRAADLPAAWLSAGQKRRAALARLLVAPRPLWLLDEPATALDAAAQELLAGVMGEHLAAGGLIVAATHAPLGLEGARELRLGGAP